MGLSTSLAIANFLEDSAMRKIVIAISLLVALFNSNLFVSAQATATPTVTPVNEVVIDLGTGADIGVSVAFDALGIGYITGPDGLVRQFQTGSLPVKAAALNPDGSQLMVATGEGKLLLIDLDWSEPGIMGMTVNTRENPTVLVITNNGFNQFFCAITAQQMGESPENQNVFTVTDTAFGWDPTTQEFLTENAPCPAGVYVKTEGAILITEWLTGTVVNH